MVLCIAVGLLLILMAMTRVRPDVGGSIVSLVAMYCLVGLSVGLGVFDACLLVASLALVVRIFRLRPQTVQWT